MRELYYENQGSTTYYVYAFDKTDVIDSLSLGMLTNNSISGFAKTIFLQMDDVRYVKYDVTARISADQFFERVVNRKRILAFLQSVVHAFRSADEYMLDPGLLLMDLPHIFVDVASGAATLICLPMAGIQTQHADPVQFFKSILFNTRFDPNESNEYVASLLNFLNGSGAFSLDGFQGLLKALREDRRDVRQPPQVRPDPVAAEPIAQPQYRQPVTPAPPACAPVPSAHASPAPPAYAPPAYAPPAFAVPPAAPVNAPADNRATPSAETESKAQKGISLFYLLQHYNKENAAAYKSQKEALKAQKEQSKKPKAGKEKTPPVAYAIPGQNPVIQQPSAQPPQPSRPLPKAAPPKPVVAAAAPAQYAPYQPQPALQFASADFGATQYMVESDDGKTADYSQGGKGKQLRPFLLRRSNGERILIDKPVFRLGRDPQFNDYTVENRYVGHSHCHIVTREGEYFLVDDGSKNHSSVNGSQIPSGQEIKIAHGYTITLANEEFEFKLF